MLTSLLVFSVAVSAILFLLLLDQRHLCQVHKRESRLWYECWLDERRRDPDEEREPVREVPRRWM